MIAPRRPEDGPKMVPRWPQEAPRGPKCIMLHPNHQDAARDDPNAPSDAPEAARWLPDIQKNNKDKVPCEKHIPASPLPLYLPPQTSGVRIVPSQNACCSCPWPATPPVPCPPKPPTVHVVHSQNAYT